MSSFGAHLSIAGGVSRAVERARKVGCDCLQIFVKPPQQWKFQNLDDAEIARFRTAAARWTPSTCGPSAGSLGQPANRVLNAENAEKDEGECNRRQEEAEQQPDR